MLAPNLAAGAGVDLGAAGEVIHARLLHELSAGKTTHLLEFWLGPLGEFCARVLLPKQPWKHSKAEPSKTVHPVVLRAGVPVPCEASKAKHGPTHRESGALRLAFPACERHVKFRHATSSIGNLKSLSKDPWVSSLSAIFGSSVYLHKVWQGSLHYTPEHCNLSMVVSPLFWCWKSNVFQMAAKWGYCKEPCVVEDLISSRSYGQSTHQPHPRVQPHFSNGETADLGPCTGPILKKIKWGGRTSP